MARPAKMPLQTYNVHRRKKVSGPLAGSRLAMSAIDGKVVVSRLLAKETTACPR